MDNTENETFELTAPAAKKDVNTRAHNVLVLRDKVLFPKVICGITLSRSGAKQLIDEAITDKMSVLVVCQKDKTIEKPTFNDVYQVGTLVKILDVHHNGDEVSVTVEGYTRARITRIVDDAPFMKAEITELPMKFVEDPYVLSKRIEELRKVQKEVLEDPLIQAHEQIKQLNLITDPETIVNICCTNSAEKVERMQELLEMNDLTQRCEEIICILSLFRGFQKTVAELKSRTDALINKSQREYFLHQQMQVIREELGDNSNKRIEELRKKAKTKKWDEATAKRVDEEIGRLERIATSSAEYAVQEQFLDTILSLPWGEYTTDNKKLSDAQHILNRDHFGIEKAKERILEFLACPEHKGVILCLYGPPGVGKTSLCKSIAESLKREYVRVSLGGMHDEAEIRGHRRTYIGAMPGRIIKNLSKTKSSNPVFVLDEIDKMCNDYHGDPTSALLEVLDPEQNKTFHDNYLDMDYDLSQVLFIATANNLQTVPTPLLDRMELIEMTGYLQEEKEQIAKKYLVPKRLKEQQQTSADMKFTSDAIRAIVNEYTRESGVRELDRQIAAVIRKALKSDALADGKWQKADVKITSDTVHTLLGKPKYTKDKYEGNDYTGCVTGLAWTQVGGEILTIETTLFPAKTPTLTLTGNLGDVMKESATIALTYIKAHATEYGIDTEVFEKNSIHLHVPEGAIPKDGPSAGITMTTAMISTLTNRKVREKIAMTGEMTLRGRVLPVGGIKEKILAAKQAGITDIILCHENEKDILDIPQDYLKGLTFHYVKDAKEVMKFALLP